MLYEKVTSAFNLQVRTFSIITSLCEAYGQDRNLYSDIGGTKARCLGIATLERNTGYFKW